MFNGSNCDRKLQLSGILAEPLNPRAPFYSDVEKSEKVIKNLYLVSCCTGDCIWDNKLCSTVIDLCTFIDK